MLRRGGGGCDNNLLHIGWKFILFVVFSPYFPFNPHTLPTPDHIVNILSKSRRGITPCPRYVTHVLCREGVFPTISIFGNEEGIAIFVARFSSERSDFGNVEMCPKPRSQIVEVLGVKPPVRFWKRGDVP